MVSNKNNSDTFGRDFWRLFRWFFIATAAIFILPYLLTRSTFLGFDFSTTGEIGDTIGGIMGPAIAIIACAFTFLAFWVQYKANIQQKELFETQIDEQKKQFNSQIKLQEQTKIDQEKIWRIERFEDRFYELLKIHISNTTELILADNTYSGKKVFQKLYTEFRFLYECVFGHIHIHCLGWSIRDFGFDKNDRQAINNISYLVYFLGIGEFSNKILIDSLRKITTLLYSKALIKYLTERKEDWRKQKNENGYCRLEFATLENTASDGLKFKYVPCDGHWQRLGTYYRHLFQAIKFVAEYDKTIIPEKAKYEYTKLIRAQLSNYEQLMLYYNSLSNLGKDWNTSENNFIARFKLIKNIPVPLADFGFNPKDKYASDIVEAKKAGKLFFEWDE